MKYGSYILIGIVVLILTFLVGALFGIQYYVSIKGIDVSFMCWELEQAREIAMHNAYNFTMN